MLGNQTAIYEMNLAKRYDDLGQHGSRQSGQKWQDLG